MFDINNWVEAMWRHNVSYVSVFCTATPWESDASSRELIVLYQSEVRTAATARIKTQQQQ